LDGSADEGGFDGQFSMAAIDQDEELDEAGTSMGKAGAV